MLEYLFIMEYGVRLSDSQCARCSGDAVADYADADRDADDQSAGGVCHVAIPHEGTETHFAVHACDDGISGDGIGDSGVFADARPRVAEHVFCAGPARGRQRDFYFHSEGLFRQFAAGVVRSRDD